MDLIPILKMRKLRLGEHTLFIPTLPPNVRADLQSLLKIMKIRSHRFQCWEGALNNLSQSPYHTVHKSEVRGKLTYPSLHKAWKKVLCVHSSLQPHSLEASWTNPSLRIEEKGYSLSKGLGKIAQLPTPAYPKPLGMGISMNIIEMLLLVGDEQTSSNGVHTSVTFRPRVSSASWQLKAWPLLSSNKPTPSTQRQHPGHSQEMEGPCESWNVNYKL